MHVLDTLNILVVTCTLCLVAGAGNQGCERDKSRIVRDVIMKEMYPLYKEAGATMPYDCPFFKDRDRYLVHEEHKEKESSTKWSCSYCGKAFIGEKYLDNHLQNRHAEHINTDEGSVCLADYCEVFRCDVLSGATKANFWDLALCMEDDMEDLTQDCKENLEACIPENLKWNVSQALKASLEDVVCSYLTCKKYWDTPVFAEQEEVGSLYAVLTVLLVVATMIYYCVAINYFFTDTFTDAYDYDEPVESLSFNTSRVSHHRPKNKPKPGVREAKRNNQAETVNLRPTFLGADTDSKEDLFRPQRSFTEAERNTPEDILNVGRLEDVELHVEAES